MTKICVLYDEEMVPSYYLSSIYRNVELDPKLVKRFDRARANFFKVGAELFDAYTAAAPKRKAKKGVSFGVTSG